jgi:hypothetical protein
MKIKIKMFKLKSKPVKVVIDKKEGMEFEIY